jgi:hypothetical protein
VNAGEGVAANAINAAAATVGSAALTKPWNMISLLGLIRAKRVLVSISACIIQPGALRFEKIQVDRYVVVLLLSAGHASASPVVDQRWDLHLFVG